MSLEKSQKYEIDIWPNSATGYLADVSKILIGSVVIGFFIPASSGTITIPVFWIGSGIAVAALAASVVLVKQ